MIDGPDAPASDWKELPAPVPGDNPFAAVAAAAAEALPACSDPEVYAVSKHLANNVHAALGLSGGSISRPRRRNRRRVAPLVFAAGMAAPGTGQTPATPANRARSRAHS